MFFQVSDDGNSPKYSSSFDIEIVPLKLNLVHNKIIDIEQTKSVARITNDHLAYISNDEFSVVKYDVIEPAKFGQLYLRGKVVDHFDQSDIDGDDLVYRQTDLQSANDKIRVTVWLHDLSVPGIYINFRVLPLIQTHVIQAVASTEIQITLHNLNATSLAIKTASIPLYEITREMRFGHIIKHTLGIGNVKRSIPVKKFTHDDILKNLVHFSVLDVPVDLDETLDDFLHFTLTVQEADIQPADGILSVKIHTFESNVLDTVDNPRRLRPNTIMNDDDTESSILANENIIMLSIATVCSLALTLIVLLVVSIYFSRRKKKNTRNGCRSEQKCHDYNNDFDADSLPPPPILSDSRPDSFLTDYMSEYCAFTSSEMNNSPITLVTDRGECSHSENSLPTSEELSSFRGGGGEIEPSYLPNCKVTPIYVDPPVVVSSPLSSVSHIYQSRDQCNPGPEWNLYGPRPDPSSSVPQFHQDRTLPIASTFRENFQDQSIPQSPMLRKNQYWV